MLDLIWAALLGLGAGIIVGTYIGIDFMGERLHKARKALGEISESTHDLWASEYAARSVDETR